MERFATAFSTIALITLIGCGGKDQPQVAQQAASSAATTAPEVAASQSASPKLTEVSPTDVVSQFLDEVRRGGEDSRANEFLTSRAREALAKIGRSVQPIGSPDARYQVTRAQSVPGQEDSMLVHCVWSEPGVNGTESDFQVVWAVQHEPVGWRISGLAIEVDPNADPVVLDFENSEIMSQHLAPASSAPGGGGATQTSQATAQNPAITR